MTDTSRNTASLRKPDLSRERLGKRYRAEARFRAYGIAAIVAALAVLTLLIGSIVSTGTGAFVRTEIALDIVLDRGTLDLPESPDTTQLANANYRAAISAALRTMFPEVTGRSDRRDLGKLLSDDAPYQLRDLVLANPGLLDQTQKVWFIAAADYDSFNKGEIPRDVPESDRRVKDKEVQWFDALAASGAVRTVFNTTFFTAGDSSQPELAGILGATVGSALTLIVTLLASFPIGVMAAVYLEEFAPKNRWTDIIEVNINNLAAVPSIVFGLLGLAVFLNFFGLPRSAPVVGGLVLALMTLPTIIIAGRAALKAVPPSIREAALGIGASKLQTVMHHVLPLAMPGILTGTIIGMARALGETAPLLMIGMVAFVVDIPQGFTDPATVLPVQVFRWSDAAERAFVERTSAAILVLLVFLVVMNLAAVLLRRKFERRW
jgi:phosphate transport system permease protein